MNFMKIRPVGAEVLSADGWDSRQTDKTKLIIDAFRNFESAPKNCRSSFGVLVTALGFDVLFPK